MNFSSALRLRLTLSFLLFGLLIAGTISLSTYLSKSRAQEQLIHMVLAAQLDYRIAYFRSTHALPPDSAPQIRGYMARGDNRFGIPPAIAGLRPGTHQIEANGRTCHVAVRQVGDLRFYVTFDTDMLEPGYSYLGLLVLLGMGLTLLAGSVFAGHWLTRHITAPLNLLTTRVNRLMPGNTGGSRADSATHDDFKTLTAAIDHYINSIEDFARREHDFANDASHELRTPLAVLRSALELLLMEPDLSDKVRERLLRLERSVTEMSDIVSGLLLLSRAPDTAPTATSRYDVALVLQEAIEQHRYLLNSKPVELVVETSAQPYINAPPPALHIVLGNLVRNAFNYTTRGCIALRLTQDCVEIQDTGIGIPADDLSHVFERHYRGSLAPSMTAGMGLGLSLTQRICDRCGWHIDISSKPGQGTRVRLLFSTPPEQGHLPDTSCA